LQVFERYSHFFLDYVNLCFTVIDKETNKGIKTMSEKIHIGHIIIVLLAIKQMADIAAFIVS